VPAGARRDFFLNMQHLVLRDGDKSMTQLAAIVHVSYQSVHKALTGPRVPSRGLTEALARSLGGQSAVDDAVEWWTAAVAEERAEPLSQPNRQTNRTATHVSSEKSAAATVASASDERPIASKKQQVVETTDANIVDPTSFERVTSTQSPKPAHDATDPRLSAREREILIAWLQTDSKSSVAERFHITPSTVRTYLQRIRAKYADMGRPAPTKASLVARAIQDGILSIDEL
jgi:DNA-binding CsgD family transcriptional regulator